MSVLVQPHVSVFVGLNHFVSVSLCLICPSVVSYDCFCGVNYFLSLTCLYSVSPCVVLCVCFVEVNECVSVCPSEVLYVCFCGVIICFICLLSVLVPVIWNSITFCMSDLFALCPSLYSIICLLFVGLTKFVSISPVYLSVPVQFMCLVNLIFWAFSNDSIVVCICSYHYFLIVSITAFQWQKTHIKYTHLSIMVKAAIWSAVYIYPNAAHLSLSLWGFMKLYIFDFFQWLF